MKSRSRTEYSLLNITTGVTGYVINTILGFICRIVFVKTLSADYLGANGLFTNILMVLSLAELGVGNAIMYALYKPLAGEDREKIASLMKLFSKAYHVIGAVVFVTGMAFVPFLEVIVREKPDIDESLYVLYIINLVTVSGSYFLSYRGILLVASQRNYIVAGVSYLVSFAQSIIQIGALIVFHNYLLYLIIQAVGIIVYNAVVFRLAHRFFPFLGDKQAESLDSEEKHDIVKNVRDLLIYKVSGVMVNGTDNILITFFKGLATTGVASNYFLLSNTLNGLLTQIFNNVTASVGNHNVTESAEDRYELFSFLNMMNFWIYGWTGIGLFLCSNDMIRLCFGDQYELPMIIPFIIALNYYTTGMMNAVWTYKHTLGLFRYGRSLQFLTGILNIVFSVLLGNLWGLPGILLATFFARALTTLWYDPYAVYRYGLHKNVSEYVKKYCLYIILVVLAAAASYLSFMIIDGSLALVLILKIIFTTVITNGVFFAALRRTKEYARLKALLLSLKNWKGRDV